MGQEEFVAKVKYCPNCGDSLERASNLVIEYWAANEIINFCWCSRCLWRGEVKKIIHVTSMEPEE